MLIQCLLSNFIDTKRSAISLQRSQYWRTNRLLSIATFFHFPYSRTCSSRRNFNSTKIIKFLTYSFTFSFVAIITNDWNLQKIKFLDMNHICFKNVVTVIKKLITYSKVYLIAIQVQWKKSFWVKSFFLKNN